MRTMKAFKIMFFVLMVLAAAGDLHAECYNEDACFKDYVSNKGENLVIAVNRDTDEVELYWSDANQDWLKPSPEEKMGIQRLYNKKVQLREMQNRLTQMRDDTWYTTNENTTGRQR